ncbi:polyserase-2-like [Gastrophryne carolinensis]
MIPFIILTLYAAAIPNPATGTVCGTQGLQVRIFGGNKVAPGEFPWHVTMTFNGKPFCGGSLISDRWIVTAAHCFDRTATEDKRDHKLWRVHLGFTKMGQSQQESSAVTVVPSRIMVHERYHTYTDGFDIALVEFSQPVNFTRFISPICLPESSHRFHLRSPCYATGLQDVADGVPLNSERSLEKVQQTLIGWKTCNCIYNTHMRPDLENPAKPGMLCITESDGKAGPCLGDSGGPVVCNEDGVWFLAGAISFSQGCHLLNSPTIISSVSFYQDWIQKNTENKTSFAPQTIAVTDDTDNDTCSDILSNQTTGCGVSQVNDPASGEPGAWPWQVELWMDGEPVCSGALISPNWVITAAECFSGPDTSDSPEDWSVTVSAGTPVMKQVAVQKISIHGSYISPEKGDNVALVLLAHSVPLGPFTQPICLPGSEQQMPYGSSCWLVTGNNSVSAFEGDQISDVALVPAGERPYHTKDMALTPGSDDEGLSEEEGPPIAQRLELIGPNQCNCIYSRPNSANRSASISEGMICASSQEPSSHCLLQSDLGGPLVCKANSTWFLMGLQGFGGSCGGEVDPKLPGVFTQLVPYESWIDQQTREPFFRPVISTPPLRNDTDRCSYDTPRVCGRSVDSPGPEPIGEATERTWPWQVSLQRYDSHVCSGVLITETWIMTAAHCIPSYTSPKDYTILLGRQSQDETDPWEVSRSIKRVVLHPDYKLKTGENDLALVEMKYGVTFSDYILPICLPPNQTTSPAGNCWVAGWGNVYPAGDASSFPPLRNLRVSLLNGTDCGSLGNITKERGQICVAAKNEAFTCLLDSSAPLVCQANPTGPWFLFGVGSQTSPPKRNACPSNFSSVVPKLSWIRGVIPEKDLSFLESNTTSVEPGHFSTTSTTPTIKTTLGPQSTSTKYIEGDMSTGSAHNATGCLGSNSGIHCINYTTVTPKLQTTTVADSASSSRPTQPASSKLMTTMIILLAAMFLHFC